MKNFNLDEWIDWQCKLHSTNMDFNLSRIKKVANRLNIHKTKSKIFTVAGTNGKGSTVSILESILIESGYNVGSYTSPHLLEFNERIKINNVSVDTNEICSAFETIEECRDDITLTFFEFSTLAAFIIFNNTELDIIILEVGLGGRFDAVNIINPDVSIITSIGLDHTAILGNDPEKIAYEKSGIMRKDKPVIVGYPEIHESIKRHSTNIGSKLNVINKQFSKEIKFNDRWIFSNSDGIKIDCENPGIKGDIQIDNAATALQAIHCCEGIKLKKDKAIKGLKKAKILGRFQILDSTPKIILDVAHNDQSINMLLKNLKKYYPKNKFHAVFSVLKDKNIDDMLNLLKGVFESWHISHSDNERALNVNDLRKNKFFISEKPSVYDNIEDAHNGAIKHMKNKNDIVVVFGSSYTVAPILNSEYRKNE